MSANSPKVATATRVRTEVRTKAAFDVALRQADLSAQEENVLRMRHGIAAPGDAVLAMRGLDRPETREALVEIEARALAAVEGQVDSARLQAIIARMRGL